MSHRTRRRWGAVPIGLAVAVMAALLAIASPTPAQADTVTAHQPLATYTGGANVSPPGPLTNLSNLQTITVRINEDTVSSTNKLSSISLRQCSGSANITNDGEFVPDGGFCTDAPLSAGADYNKGPVSKVNSSDTFIETTFKVGTGTRDFQNSGTGDPIHVQCDAAHDCDLWVRISSGEGIDFVHWDLQFALSQPGAPTAVAATCGTNQLGVSWTAPSNTGGGTLVNYIVDIDPSAGAPVGTVDPADQTVPASPTNTTVSGLTNFSSYDIVVRAVNQGQPGSTQTSVDSSPVVVKAPCVTQAPVQSAPTAVGDSTATINWTFTDSATPAHTAYRIHLVPNSGSPSDVAEPNPAATSRPLSGLSNGVQYTVTVFAVYAGGESLASNTQTMAPVPSTLITQTIKVRRPTGALVLTQLCTQAPLEGRSGDEPAFGGGYFAPSDGFTGAAGADDPLRANAGGLQGYPYPQDANGDPVANYPTDCGIQLSAAKLDTTAGSPTYGSVFKSTGALNTVTVVDSRDGAHDTGWTLKGTMGDFATSDGVGTINGNQLGWLPVGAAGTNSFTTGTSTYATNYADGATYTLNALVGGTVAPQSSGAAGLKNGQTLGQTNAASGLGISKFGADLTLFIPITAREGQYRAVMTITAIPKP